MKVRAAAVQAASVAFNSDASLDKLVRLARQAAGGGAHLVVFPEVFLSGYPRGLSFGATIGNRTAEGRDEFLRYFQGSIEVPGPACDRMAELACELGIHLVTGVTERAGGTLYCTVLFFSPESGLLGKHRKLMPTASERVIWGCGDGSTMPVFPTPIGRLGAAICWENYMPLYRNHLYEQGVELYCAPTADGRDSWTATMRHIAMEGRCFVIGCNQFATRADYPAEYRTPFGDDPKTVLSRGGSCIVSPLGEVLAGPVYDREAIVEAELDVDDIVRSKLDFDATGHYARRDIFQVSVNPLKAREGGDGT